MSLRYETLTVDERFAIVEARLRELEADHYANSLMRKSIQQATDVQDAEREQMLIAADNKLETLERAIAVHRQERDGLGASESSE